MKLKIVKQIDIKVINFLFNLRNKKYVRINSLNQKKISYKKHIIWSKKYLSKKNKLFIIHSSNNYIGYLRMDYKNKNLETSWALFSNFKGKGIMTNTLKKATSKKFGVHTYISRILNKNKASLNLAKKCGFKKIRIYKKYTILKKNNFY